MYLFVSIISYFFYQANPMIPFRIVIMNLGAFTASGTIWLNSVDRDSATASTMPYLTVGKALLLSDALPVPKSISMSIKRLWSWLLKMKREEFLPELKQTSSYFFIFPDINTPSLFRLTATLSYSGRISAGIQTTSL
jgi:hypothetical protein